MKILRADHRIKLLLLFLLLVPAASAAAQGNESVTGVESPLPAPTGFINDYVGVIDPAVRQRLEERLTNFKNANDPPIELAVAIVKTTGDRPIFDYSLAVARGWGIGAKQDDNPSALLLVAIDDRKYFTQVSRDLEDELPDGLVGQLQRQYLVPAFRQSNYSKGVEDTLEAYIRTIEQRTSGTTVPAGNTATNQQQQPRAPTVGRSSLSTIGCCLIGLIVLMILIFSRASRKSRRDHDRWGGGGGGFGGGGGALPWIIGSIIANSGSSSSGWSSGGSSDWGGGGDSGGWGGFGGGGDFGGGGAGGDW